jgi:hypothetical protein
MHPSFLKKSWRDEVMKVLDGHVWNDEADGWIIRKKIKNGKLIWARIEKCRNSNGQI